MKKAAFFETRMKKKMLKASRERRWTEIKYKFQNSKDEDNSKAFVWLTPFYLYYMGGGGPYP